MKTKFLIFAVFFQIFIVLFGLIYSQIILKFGDEIRLKVHPRDPRDILRGDYVALSYEIPNFTTNCYLNKISFQVFAILQKDINNNYYISEISCDKKGKIYLKSTVTDHYAYITKPVNYRIYVEFDIEKFFTTPQNAKEIEKNMLNGGETFLNLRVMNGKAVVESLQSNGKIYKN